MTKKIIILIVILAVYGLLELTEAAVVDINDNKLEKLAGSGDKRAVRLRKIIKKPGRFLGSVRTAAAAAAFMAASLSAVFFCGKVSALIDRTGADLSCGALAAVAAALISFIAVIIVLTIGRLVPRGLAAKDPEKTALRLSGFAGFITAVFSPLSGFMSLTSNGILRLMGIDPHAADNTVTEEEILMMSDAGAEKGTIDEDENRIIKNIFAFDDLTAEQVCTHRPDVSVLWNEDSTDVWEETIHRTRHSFLPICGENVDDVIGVLDAKDYFRLDDKSRENIMANAVSEPCFVHENMKADRLFEQMKQKGADHFAVVVDEYGGMTGIITITDLVEELVGDFADDESDEPSARLEKLEDDLWSIPGITSLSEVSEELDMELPAEKYDTFGGYVVAELGHIPKNGSQETLEADGLSIEVLEVKHHRIELCRVRVLHKAETADTDED
ncbi:MAG: HlyC/CorC family transporter [Ruminococcus sp.]|nr:HlyC/CorC family transporter [Ruminococcus sp.]